MKFAKFFLASTLVFGSMHAHAISDLMSIKDFDAACTAGERLKENMLPGNALRAGLCMGLIRGVVEWQFFAGSFDRTVCFPDGFKWSDANKDIIGVAKSLKDEKFENLIDEAAVVVISRRLALTYPCPKK
jgi:hypothetical protein